ncbi:lytic transglycosylase domain-containing protein [Egibacter rhizosphaerae]|uniref:lytic transglycosylase domain-containing protein n=1 Tax=Egibacter rhizosphaerae TaxID=1670831 RepID=UPI0013F155FA|nr:lytic transglycosylase domain-containing protein [Egibacter rhizosphaerae]
MALSVAGAAVAGHTMADQAEADEAPASMLGEPTLEVLPETTRAPADDADGADADDGGHGAGGSDGELEPLDEDVPIEAALVDGPSVVQPIVAAAERKDIEPELALSLAWHESRFDADAQSVAGAVGVMQVMPETAERMADELDESIDPWDPADNALAASAYLTRMIDEHDNVENALIAYNQGPVALAEDGAYPEAQEFADNVLETRDRLREVDW